MNPQPIRLIPSCFFVAILGSQAAGCALSARPSTTSAGPRPGSPRDDPRAHVYRLDFVVTSGEASAPPSKEQFTLNLLDREHGDISVGRDVPLQAGGLNGAVSPRTDVGLRLGATCSSSGEDVLAQVRLEVSDPENVLPGIPTAIHKATGEGDVLLKLGEPTLALRMDDGHKQYDVNVLATRLR